MCIEGDLPEPDGPTTGGEWSAASARTVIVMCTISLSGLGWLQASAGSSLGLSAASIRACWTHAIASAAQPIRTYGADAIAHPSDLPTPAEKAGLAISLGRYE